MATVIEPSSTPTPGEEPESGKLAGVIGEFESPKTLLEACRRIRDMGYSKWDSYTPFPVHGVDEAMGIRPTLLPWIVLGGGITGCCIALMMQLYLNGVELGNLPFTILSGYAYIISGKPMFSLPANIPIAFELTILLSAFGAFFGMLAMNQLLQWYSPLFKLQRFARVTNDRFFIGIDAKDPKFDEESAKSLLSGLGASAVEEAWDNETRMPPAIFKTVGVVVVVLALIPPVIVARYRATTWTTPRIHPVQDMDFQPKFKPQQRNIFFADERAMRPPVAGAIGRGELELDEELFEGTVPEGQVARNDRELIRFASLLQDEEEAADEGTATGEGAGEEAGEAGAEAEAAAPPPVPGEPQGNWTEDVPVEVTDVLMRRGKERYEIFCAPCHGIAADGDGLVNERAISLGQPTWLPAPSLHTKTSRNRPNGYIYHAIANGVRKMPGYGHQIPVKDRWAIVLYVRALQLSRSAPAEELSAELKGQLQAATQTQDSGS